MTNQKPVVTLSEYRSRMHSALLKIRYFCQQRVDQPLSNTIQPMSMSSNTNPHSSSNSIRLTEICGTLLMYLKTALENPNVPRYRRIAIENNHFKTTLGILLSEIGAYGQNGSIVSLCDEYMASIGFVRRGAYYEWLWMRLQKQQNDAPELTTSAPQYRFSSGYTSRHTGKSSLDANQSQNNNNTNNINNTGAQDGINSDLLDRIPDDFVADAIIRECLKLLNDLKNTGNLELMSSESFYKNSNSSSGYISSSSLLPSSSSIFDQSQATNEARAVAVAVFPSVTPSTATVSYSPFPTNLATNATATSNSSMTLPILSSSSETQGLHSVVSDKASGSVAPISFAEVNIL